MLNLDVSGTSGNTSRISNANLLTIIDRILNAGGIGLSYEHSDRG